MLSGAQELAEKDIADLEDRERVVALVTEAMRVRLGSASRYRMCVCASVRRSPSNLQAISRVAAVLLATAAF